MGPSPKKSSLWARFQAIVPFVVTSLVTVMVTLFLQLALPIRQSPPRPERASFQPPAPSPESGAFPSRGLPVVPVVPATSTAREPRIAPQRLPGAEALSDEAMSRELRSLRAELRDLWSAYYLARAAIQLADAEVALRVNDLDEIERLLATAAVSLDLAYEHSSEQDKGPIGEFRAQVGAMHEDLAIRPENLDLRMRRLRQSMLSLANKEP